MMKLLTVDETWVQCLAMWKWISRQCKGKSLVWCNDNVSDLKIRWLEKHGIRDGEISQNCFFCHKSGARYYICGKCPARQVDPEFSCMDIGYSFLTHPRKFYAKLKELNKIRLQGDQNDT